MGRFIVYGGSCIGIVIIIFILFSNQQAAIKELQYELQQSISKQEGVIQKTRDELLRVLSINAGPAGNSANVTMRQAAAGQRALDLGMKAMEAGNTDQAILFFINGVNHDPSRMELIRALANAALNSTNHDIIDRVIGILELVIIQIPADDISETLNYIARLKDINITPLQKISSEEAKKRWDEINAEYSPEKIWQHSELISLGLSDIESLEQEIEQAQIDIDNDLFKRILKESEQLSKQLKVIQLTLPIYTHVESCVAQLSDAIAVDNPDQALISSLYMSGQNMLSQIWGQLQYLPISMQDAFKKLPNKLYELEFIYQKKIWYPILTSEIENMKAIINYKSYNYTTKINNIIAIQEKLMATMNLITSQELKDQFLIGMKEVTTALKDLTVKRHSAYQRWTLVQLNGFLTQWNDKLRVSDETAMEIYDTYRIAEIDENLLIPEVRRMFEHVMTCMIEKLGAKEGAALEYRQATSEKKRLEEF